MSEILKAIFGLKDNMEDDWRDKFDEYNMLEDVKPIYDNKALPIKTKNIIISFVVLAYDNESKWIEIHKDRFENKTKILKRLGGDPKIEPYKSVLHGTHEDTQKIVRWFLLYQRDYRWDSVFAYFDYHSEMMRFAGARTPDTETSEPDKEGKTKEIDLDIDKLIASNIKKGELIKKANEMRLQGEALLAEIQKDFVTIDTALEKEGKGKLSDTADIMKWEHAVASWTKRR